MREHAWNVYQETKSRMDGFRVKSHWGQINRQAAAKRAQQVEEIPSIQVILTSMPFEDSACHSHGGISSIRPKMVVSESSATGQEEAGGGVGWDG